MNLYRNKINKLFHSIPSHFKDTNPIIAVYDYTGCIPVNLSYVNGRLQPYFSANKIAKWWLDTAVLHKNIPTYVSAFAPFDHVIVHTLFKPQDFAYEQNIFDATYIKLFRGVFSVSITAVPGLGFTLSLPSLLFSKGSVVSSEVSDSIFVAPRLTVCSLIKVKASDTFLNPVFAFSKDIFQSKKLLTLHPSDAGFYKI